MRWRRTTPPTIKKTRCFFLLDWKGSFALRSLVCAAVVTGGVGGVGGRDGLAATDVDFMNGRLNLLVKDRQGEFVEVAPAPFSANGESWYGAAVIIVVVGLGGMRTGLRLGISETETCTQEPALICFIEVDSDCGSTGAARRG
ncbi:predicted protein [Histoplasma capsulatum H143]|uniref:Uncharacterized protein n=1 Tax=Ajellomyces capsulatus (strain H143) TaxID=544712 RepID=C6HS57_AJECH|nr:predicted protein [Histoplasma capsulatum H143]